MVESISLASIVIHSIHEIFGGTAHHLTEKAAERIWNQVRIYLGNENNRHQNHDLRKAVRLAMLYATLDSIEGFSLLLDESRREEEDAFMFSMSTWVKYEIDNIEESIEKVEYPSFEIVEPKLLIASVLPFNQKAIIEFAETIKNAWILEMEGELKYELPELMKKCLLEGWDKDQCHYDWFEIVCCCFGEILKGSELPGARNAFQNHLLAEISTHLDGLDFRLDIFLEKLQYLKKGGEEFRHRQEQISLQNERTHRSLTTIDQKIDFSISSARLRHTNLMQVIRRISSQLSSLETSATSPQAHKQIDQLRLEKESLYKQLIQTKDEKAREEKLRGELESSLRNNTEINLKRELARQAYAANDYITGLKWLREATAERIEKVAEDVFEIGKGHELLHQTSEALNAYELAARMAPTNSAYQICCGEIYHEIGLWDKAAEYFSKALRIETADDGSFKKACSDIYYRLGDLHRSKKEYSKSIECYNLALSIGIAFNGSNDIELFDYYDAVGLSQTLNGDYDIAIETLTKALDFGIALYTEKNEDVAMCYNNLGLACCLKGDRKQAIQYYRKSLESDRDLHFEECTKIAIRYNNLGAAHRDLGELEIGIQYLEKALAIDLKFHGEDHPDVATDYYNLAVSWFEKEDYKKALEYFHKTVAIEQKFFPNDLAERANKYKYIGFCYWADGKESRAISYFKKAIALKKKTSARGYEVAMIYQYIGHLYIENNEPLKALSNLDKAVKFEPYLQDEDQETVAEMYKMIASSYSSLNESAKACLYFNKCYSIFLKLFGEQDERTIDIQSDLDELQSINHP